MGVRPLHLTKTGLEAIAGKDSPAFTGPSPVPVHIICKDPGAAAKWYADMLGGTITRSGEVWGAPQIAVQFEGATIKEKGDEFSVEPYEFAPGTRIAYLAGPDGVSIELVESKAQ